MVDVSLDGGCFFFFFHMCLERKCIKLVVRLEIY